MYNKYFGYFIFVTAIFLQPVLASAYGTGVPPVTGLGARVGRVLGTHTKQSPDYIPWNQAPSVANRIFKDVYGRSMKHNESVYWKRRARTDKVTESAIKDAMQWHKSVDSFGPKQSKSTRVQLLRAKLSSIFYDVFGRLPGKREYAYWSNRIMDKFSTPALRGAMIFHLNKTGS